MSKHRQQGSHHIGIVILIAVLLVGAIGYVFWHNVGGVMFAKRISLGTEYRLSEKQSVAIGNTNDIFEITGFTYCPDEIDINGRSHHILCDVGDGVNYKITSDKGVSKNNTPPTKWNVDIVKSDYQTYAIIKITSNNNWEKELAEYSQEKVASEKEFAALAQRDSEYIDAKMASAKSVKLGEEFTFHDDNGGGVSSDVYKISDGSVTYYVEADISPGDVFYYVYKNTMHANTDEEKQTGIIVRCNFMAELPFGIFTVVKTDYDTYATLIASHSPPVFTPIKC